MDIGGEGPILKASFVPVKTSSFHHANEVQNCSRMLERMIQCIVIAVGPFLLMSTLHLPDIIHVIMRPGLPVLSPPCNIPRVYKLLNILNANQRTKTGEPWERNYDVYFKFTPYHVSPISIALNFYIPVSICNWEGPLHCQNWASTCPLHFHPLSHCQAVKQFGRKGKHPCGIFSILIRNSGLLDYLRQLLFLNCFPI